MRHRFDVVAEERSLYEAWTRMRIMHVRHLCVSGKSGLLGVLSARDVQNALPADDEALVSLSRIPLTTVLQYSDATIRPDASIDEAAAALIELKLSAMAVVVGGKPVGILTREDCLIALDPVGQLAIRD
jgi:CBS domain-containing protein